MRTVPSLHRPSSGLPEVAVHPRRRKRSWNRLQQTVKRDSQQESVPADVGSAEDDAAGLAGSAAGRFALRSSLLIFVALVGKVAVAYFEHPFQTALPMQAQVHSELI